MPSIVLPSASTPVERDRLRCIRPAFCGGRQPVDRELQCPAHGDARIAARSVRWPRTTPSSAGRCRFVQLAQTGLQICTTRRAAVSASPAAWAWSMAFSGIPFASHHAAARRWSSGTTPGSASPQLRHEQLSEQLVVPVPPRRRSSGTTSRLRRSNRSRNAADPVTPTTASQSGPHIRSRIDVCVRKEASAADTRSRISERR